MNQNSSNIRNCFKLCSYNCRSVKRSLPEIQQLCEKHDLVVLQEHWLFPDLSGVHADFLCNGSSAMDVSNKILVGRPYGGTAILYRKSIADHISVVPTSDPRLTAVKMQTRHGPVLIINVYMPTDYHDDDS